MIRHKVNRDDEGPLHPESRSIVRLLERMNARSGRPVMEFFRIRMDLLIGLWIGSLVLAGLLKVLTATTAPASWIETGAMLLPFLAVAAAPIMGYRFAANIPAAAIIATQPSLRLARVGRWRAATEREVARMQVRGPTMFMVSLIVGILLNVPVRAFEFLAIVPAVAARDPLWVHVLVQAFTLDAVVMSFAYMVCFVLAQRSAPLFPRLLACAWVLDMAMQLLIALALGSRSDVPPEVAAPLAAILVNNVKKVAISVVLWLPFLLLSDSVNLAFRQRVRVAA